MDFPVAIRAQENTFIDFCPDSGPAPCVAFIRDTEILHVGIDMMKFQCFEASIITTYLALSPLKLNRRYPDLSAALLHRRDQIITSGSINTLILR